MAYYKVERYRARWKYEDHQGDFNIGYTTGSSFSWKIIPASTPEEFAVMIDLLRNESPIWYDDYSHNIQTTHDEFVG